MTLNDTLTTQYFGNYLSLISAVFSTGLCARRPECPTSYK